MESGDTVDPGIAYWAHFASETTVTIQGTALTGENQTVSLESGWNMIGSPFETTMLSEVTLDGVAVGSSPLVETELFYYDETTGDYVPATILLPWKGYFIKVGAGAAGATLSMPNGGTIINPGQITGTATLQGLTDFTGITVRIPATSFQAVTDSAGLFTINNVPAGTWSVEASMTGYTTTTVTGIVVTSGQATSAGTIELLAESTQGPSISNFSPIADATVTTATPTISADFTDTGNGVDVSSAIILVNAVDVSSSSSITTSGFSYVPASPIADGSVDVSVTISDNSANSTTATNSFTIATAADPNQPTNIQATPCSNGTHTLLCVTWTAAENTNVNAYNVYVYHDTETYDAPYNGSRAIPVTRTTVGGLTPGESYGIEITGAQVDGSGALLQEYSHSARATKSTVATAGNQAVVSIRAIGEEDSGYAGRRIALSKQGTGLLKGLVSIPDAASVLKDQQGNQVASGTTEEFGWVEFVVAEAGQYDMVVTDDGGTPGDPGDDIYIDKQDISLTAGGKYVVPNAYLSTDGSGEYCGDGIINRCEQCDDGNRDDGDGCSWICEREDPSMHGGAICSDETWAAADSPHIVADYVLVRGFNDPTLTIEPGSVVKFYPGTGIFVGRDVQTDGALIADGTSGPITFTSNESAPAAGDWLGLMFLDGALPTSVLDNVTVEYAGGATASVSVDAPINRFKNSAISNGGGIGVAFGPAGYAVNGFEGNSVTGHAEHPVDVYPNYASYMLGSNVLTGNGSDLIRVQAGDVSTAGTWRNQGVPYEVVGQVNILEDITVENDVTVKAGADVAVGDFANRPVLTIGTGGLWEFGTGVKLEVGHEDSVNWDYGTLIANGATGAITFTSSASVPSSGDWVGVELGPRTEPTTSLDNVIIEYAGSATASLLVMDKVDKIQNSIIRNGAGVGVYFGSVGYAQNGFATNTVTGHAQNPITAYPGGVPYLLGGNTLTGNGDDTIIVESGISTAAGYWRNYGIPYQVNGDVTIDTVSPYNPTIFESGLNMTFAGSLFVETDLTFGSDITAEITGDVIVADFAVRPELTIGSGNTIKFGPGSTLNAGVDEGLTDYGNLIADGSGGAITFTSAAAVPAAGDWEGITFGTKAQAVSLLDNVTVEYAGSATASVTVMAHINKITNSSIINGSGIGVDFRDGGYAENGFATNTVTGNAQHPVNVYANYGKYILGGNALTGNGNDVMKVEADTVNSPVTWRNNGAPIEFQGDINFVEDSTFDENLTVVALGDIVSGEFAAMPVMTIGSGGTWKFAAGKKLYVGNESSNWDYGYLIADGSGGEITFTSNSDTPAAGDWMGIHLGPRTRPGTIINNCSILYGGANGYGNIYLNGTGTDATVTNNTIGYSSTYGVYVDVTSTFSSPDELTNAFTTNSSGDVFRE